MFFSTSEKVDLTVMNLHYPCAFLIIYFHIKPTFLFDKWVHGYNWTNIIGDR